MQIFQACGYVLQLISQENIALWCHKLWLCAWRVPHMHFLSHPYFSFSFFAALTAGAVVHRPKSAEWGYFHFYGKIFAVM